MPRCFARGHYYDPQELIGGKCPKCIQEEINASLRNAQICITEHQQDADENAEINRHVQILETNISQIEEYLREPKEYWMNIEQCLNRIALALESIKNWDRVHRPELPGQAIVDDILADVRARAEYPSEPGGDKELDRTGPSLEL